MNMKYRGLYWMTGVLQLWFNRYRIVGIISPRIGGLVPLSPRWSALESPSQTREKEKEK